MENSREQARPPSLGLVFQKGVSSTIRTQNAMPIPRHTGSQDCIIFHPGSELFGKELSLSQRSCIPPGNTYETESPSICLI